MHKTTTLIQRMRRAAGIVVLALILPACGGDAETLDGFTIGFSSRDDNLVWIREAEFDGTWTVPGGSIGCCWREAGGMSGIGPGPMPTSVRVRWDDESRGVIYEAETELPGDLTERALELPPITRHANGEVRRNQFLIIGLRDDGSMVIWLSNSEHPKGIDGYVLETVAEAAGRIVRRMRPGERLSTGE